MKLLSISLASWLLGFLLLLTTFSLSGAQDFSGSNMNTATITIDITIELYGGETFVEWLE